MSLINAVRRRRTAALTSGAALLVALTGAAIVPSAEAASPTVTGVSVFSGYTTTVHTSTGKDLRLSLDSYKSAGDTSPASISVQLELPTGGESHRWSFQMPRSAFNLNSDGKGTLDLGAAKMGPFGKIALKVTPLKPATYTTCQGTKVSKQRKVSIDGTLLLDTGSAWGTVGKGKTIHFNDPSYVSWSYKNNADCSGTYTIPCFPGTSWYASTFSGGDSVSLYGGEANGRSSISASRSHTLSKPAGASRSDYISSTVPAPKLSVKPDGSAKMSVKGDVGGATLTSPNPGSKGTPEKCGSNGKKEQSTSWSADYKNAATHLKVKAQVFGAISLPDGQSTYSSFSKTKIVS